MFHTYLEMKICDFCVKNRTYLNNIDFHADLILQMAIFLNLFEYFTVTNKKNMKSFKACSIWSLSLQNKHLYLFYRFILLFKENKTHEKSVTNNVAFYFCYPFLFFKCFLIFHVNWLLWMKLSEIFSLDQFLQKGKFVIFCADYISQKKPKFTKSYNIIHTKINPLKVTAVLLLLWNLAVC